MEMQSADPRPLLAWSALDIERRLGLPAGRFTQPGQTLPILLAAVATVGFYASLILFKDQWIGQTFMERGKVPYFTVFFTAWALMILVVKRRKIALQRRALALPITPEDPQFTITVGSANRLIEQLHEAVDDPSRFILFNRIHIALSNLRNLGRTGDVDEVLRTQADADEAASESSYTLVRGLIWAIPVLGFIGTVLGLSDAIGGFGEVLSKSAELETIKSSLQVVTAGLATAFETTLHALVAALGLQMVVTFTKRSEEQMFDDFMEYCQRRIIHRLRLQSEEPRAQEGVYETQPA